MWLPPALFLLSLPGCFSLQGPESVSGSEEGSVTVQCHYDTGWETHRKWWCQGKIWNFCKILIQSRGSEQEVKKDRMSIRDNHRNRSFTVTMEKLSREDADTYWCGIEKKGSDLGVQVKVTVGPAKTVLTTPTNLSSKPLAMSSTFYVRSELLSNCLTTEGVHPERRAAGPGRERWQQPVAGRHDNEKGPLPELGAWAYFFMMLDMS
nr:CMRF35-like molecule 7 isoform X2 [Loxodonta africana]